MQSDLHMELRKQEVSEHVIGLLATSQLRSFKCSATAQDSLEHYCQCTRLDAALAFYHRRTSDAPLDDFFGVRKNMSLQDRVLRGKVLHVKLRMIHFAKLHGSEHDLKFLAGVEWAQAFGQKRIVADGNAEDAEKRGGHQVCQKCLTDQASGARARGARCKGE